MEKDYPLLDFNSIVNQVANIIMSDWEKPDDDDKDWFPGLGAWVNTQTAKALNHRIHDQWERLLDKVDDKVINVHRACYHHLFNQPDIIRDKRLYKYDKLVKDLQDYGACAVALNRMDYLGKRYVKKNMSRKKYLEILNNSLETSSFSSSTNGHIEKYWSDIKLDYKLEMLQDNWRKFYSDTGELYDELNETIENLPGNLSSQSIIQLPSVHLQRPITNRLEFIFVMSLVDKLDGGIPYPLMFATEGEIKEAIDIYNEYRKVIMPAWQESTSLSYAKTSSIKSFVNYVVKDSNNLSKDIVTIMDKIKDDALIEKI